MIRRPRVLASVPTVSFAALAIVLSIPIGAAPNLQTPEQFAGHRIGADNKLVRWDKIVEYMRLVAQSSDRVRVRELGKSTNGEPFIALEISAPDTLKNLDRFKQLQRKLYFQGGAPTDAERDEIFRSGKAVVLVTCSIHATEIGASQMTLELVHRLATEESSTVRKILDNVIFVLVPSLNPDGQTMVTDWFNKNLGTEFANSPIPYLYHPYVGHDNNRDMYMFTQKESQHTAKLLWSDWYPSVWLDEHQMGSNGARIFVMPATDPINPNVHPLIYRWNGILGQSQAAALEAAGKEGIIYNSTYTNFWQGAMAWSGWWHNQVGLLTEVASVRVAAPTEQQRAQPGRANQASDAGGRGEGGGRGGRGGGEGNVNAILPAPTDVNSRTEYPRPWLGGRWTLRDIIDYELIATMALLETAADRRETLLRQIYDVNKDTVEAGRRGDPAAILIPVDGQHDAREAIHLVEKLQMAGVDVYRASAGLEADGKSYASGTFVVPMAQVFARYAKDILERQTYPEVRRAPNAPPEPPYDVSAWSLGMLLGVDHVLVKKPLAATVALEKLTAAPAIAGKVTGNGARFTFDYAGPDAAIAINRLLKSGASISLASAREGAEQVGRVTVTGVGRQAIDAVATELGLSVKADAAANRSSSSLPSAATIRAPRIGMYDTWAGGNMDEGWTRWVLEQYGFNSTRLHNADVKAGKLRDKYDAIIIPDQSVRGIVDGNTANTTRPEYRGGIGDDGVAALRAFVNEGGTLIALGAACDFAIEKFPVPVRNVKSGLTRDQHFAPGTILRIQVDTQHPIGFGMAAETYGFYNNSPFFTLVEGFASQHSTVVVRYPNTEVVGSGWLRGEELMTGRAAVVSVDMNPGRVVLFGLRPQHRAQTHATFPLLFNALYLSTVGKATS
jgi:Zinc carboxypeptidase